MLFHGCEDCRRYVAGSDTAVQRQGRIVSICVLVTSILVMGEARLNLTSPDDQFQGSPRQVARHPVRHGPPDVLRCAWLCSCTA